MLLFKQESSQRSLIACAEQDVKLVRCLILESTTVLLAISVDPFTVMDKINQKEQPVHFSSLLQDPVSHLILQTWIQMVPQQYGDEIKGRKQHLFSCMIPHGSFCCYYSHLPV